MPIYRDEGAALSRQASELSQLLLGQDHDEAKQKRAIQAERAAAQQNADLKAQQQAADFEAARGGLKGLPAGSQVHYGSASINTPDPLMNLIRGQGMNDKMLDNERLETQALQNEYKKLGGVDPERIKSLDTIEKLLGQNTQISHEQMRSALARASGEKGPLSDSDISRAMPNSLGQVATKMINFVRPGTINSSLSQGEKDAVMGIVNERRATEQGARESAAKELGARANTLAPTLNRSGKLDQTMGSLGLASQSPEAGVKKQYSQSRNQTRFVYPDGRIEIKDGKH